MKRALLLACCLGLLCGLVPGASFGWPDGEHIFLVDLDGELRDLTPDSPSSRDPVYSPRGTQIAYVGTAVDGDLEFPEVFVMNADGANSHRVTHGHLLLNPDVADDWTTVSWSRDGKLLAFDSGLFKIYVVHPDGGGLKEIGQGLEPTWGPRGRIAYRTNIGPDETNSSIAIATARGKVLKKITVRTAYATDAAWAAGARALAFVAEQGEEEPSAIIVARAPRFRPKVFAHGDSPAWAPRGNRLAFATDNGIYVGSLRRRPRLIATCVDYCSAPAWSSDGRLLAWINDGDLTIARPNGKDPRTVETYDWPASAPVWRPGKRELVYSSG
jgi:Tol biopolymer transport system component